jgi:hypothetical protein
MIVVTFLNKISYPFIKSVTIHLNYANNKIIKEKMGKKTFPRSQLRNKTKKNIQGHLRLEPLPSSHTQSYNRDHPFQHASKSFPVVFHSLQDSLQVPNYSEL